MVKILRKTVSFDKSNISEYRMPNEHFIYHITPVIGIKKNTEEDKVEEIIDVIEGNKGLKNILLSIIVGISMIYKIPVWVIEYSPVILMEIENLILTI